MRVLFTLQYVGTRYAGWQRQANALAVQQVIEEVLGQFILRRAAPEDLRWRSCAGDPSPSLRSGSG